MIKDLIPLLIIYAAMLSGSLFFLFLLKKKSANLDLPKVSKENKSFYEKVIVELDSGQTFELIRVFENNFYTYYMLDGTYIHDLKNFCVIKIEPMTMLWYKNQDKISYEDMEVSPNAMRSGDLKKLKCFK